MDLLRKKTSKIMNTNNGAAKPKKSALPPNQSKVDDKDPETFIPLTPSLENLENDADLQKCLEDERKKAIYYWYEAEDKDGWEEFDNKDGVEMHYYGTDAENEFYIKRIIEVEANFKDA